MLGFTILSDKTSLERKWIFFRHFSPTFLTQKIFYQTNIFLQTEVKVELQINF